MELSKSSQSTAFQTSINHPQIPQSDSQFPIFTPTNWALLQNRSNLPNPNSLPIRPFAPSRILMPWESPLQPVQSPHQHQLRPNVQNTPQIPKSSPKSGPPKGLSKQISNKRPIQQIESAQKSQNSQAIESVRSKLRESLASSLSIPTGQRITGEDYNPNSETKSHQDEPSNDSTSIVDELLQGNGLCWTPDSLLIPQNPNSPQNPKTLALKIESELFRLFNGPTKKYKEKGRSLLFNLKDPSNPKLRERVFSGEISPQKLCAMSAEELASDELSEWRQAKAEEMDKMIVLPDESALQNVKRVKKTHKGEFVVIEEEKDADVLGMEIRAGTGVAARAVERKNEGEDLMLELMGDDILGDADHLSPVVTLDEFMKDLDSEPPFVDIVAKHDKERNQLEISSENGLEISSERKEMEISSERKEMEVMWQGVVQMNLAALASVAAFYRSGEKPLSMKEWPGFIEIKGRVRLDPFEKFLKDLPLSRSRAIMLTEIKWKEGSMESGRQNLLETIDSYIADSRVGLAEPGPGVELYLCPSNEKMLELFAKLLPKDLSANLQLSKTSLIGVIVWRRPVLTTVSPKLHKNNNNNNVKKENVGSVNRSSSFRERERNNGALKTVKNDNDDDDVPPGFGHLAVKNKDDDDLPEFDFRASANTVSAKPVQQMRDLIQKYGSSKSSSLKSGFRKNLSVETKWNSNDDDDIPEWNPNQDFQKPGNQISNFEQQQNARSVYSSNNNAQFGMLQPPLNAPVMPVAQPNYQANYQVNNVNYQASNVNYQVSNSNNQWWGQGASSAQQQQQTQQFGYRMPNQNWRGN